MFVVEVLNQIGIWERISAEPCHAKLEAEYLRRLWAIRYGFDRDLMRVNDFTEDDPGS